jgi:hypothetical protein
MTDRRPPESSRDRFPQWSLDFAAALRQLRDQGAGESAQATMLRVVWLRTIAPGSTIATDVIRIDPDVVVMSAQVTLPDGTSASGIAADVPDDHPSLAVALETAETRAIGRALDVLGLVLPPEDEPRTRPEPQPLRAQERTRQPTRTEEPPAVVEALRRVTPPGPRSIRPMDDEVPAEEPAGGRFATPTPFPARSDGGDDDVVMEDITWTSFWRWARSAGFHSRQDIEQRIGRPMSDMTPSQVRTALRESGVTQ